MSRLEWYSWELHAESLEISEYDNVIACSDKRDYISKHEDTGALLKLKLSKIQAPAKTK